MPTRSDGPFRRATRLLRPVLTDRLFAAIVFGVAAGVLAIPVALESWLTRVDLLGLAWFDGLFTGFLLAVFFALILYLALIYTGANAYVVGGIAERWTAEELAKLGLEWQHFRNLSFDEGHSTDSYQIDVDHVAIGPYGVVVVETKFSTAKVDLTSEAPSELIDDAIRQVSRNAGRLRALLERDAPFASVVAALVFWGPRVVDPVRGVRHYDDVRALSGKASEHWLPRLRAGRSFSAEEIDLVVSKIKTYESSRTRRGTPADSPGQR